MDISVGRLNQFSFLLRDGCSSRQPGKNSHNSDFKFIIDNSASVELPICQNKYISREVRECFELRQVSEILDSSFESADLEK